tara:strand:- start:200 stop:595 length:396 start_codon:yes stop_codon:yes gene_type:complete
MTEALSRAELERWVLDFTDAFNREDLDAVMAYFAEDSFYDEFHGTRHHGKEAIRAAFAPQFEGAFGKVRFEEEDYFLDVEAGKAMISWTCTLETKQGPGGWRGLDLLRFVDGKLVEKHTYAKTKAPLLQSK